MPSGYDFPLRPPKQLGGANKKIQGKFSYNNSDYVALSYKVDNNTINMLDYNSYFTEGLYLDFGQVVKKEGKTTYEIVPYGYLWIKLLHTYENNADISQYVNIKDMPNILEQELDDFLQIELSVRELSQDLETVTLSYDGVNDGFYWKYGTIEFGGNSYVLLVAQDNIENTSIHKITENDDGGYTYSLITDISLQRMIMNVYDKRR